MEYYEFEEKRNWRPKWINIGYVLENILKVKRNCLVDKFQTAAKNEFSVSKIKR